MGVRHAALVLVGALLVLPGTAHAQSDVELAGLMRGGARPPRGYYETLRRDPNLRSNPSLARAVRARWGDRLSLASVG